MSLPQVDPENNSQGDLKTREGTTSHVEIGRVAFRAPPFWKSNPDLWFLQLESQFITAGITAEETKFHSAIAALDCNILATVSDIIRSPPSGTPYKVLKSRIIEQYADSEQIRLKTLLQDVQLGDGKPSQLLAHMKTLAHNQVDNDALLKTLFLIRLPISMQQILSVCKEDLDGLALIADKIAEVGESPVLVSSVSTPPPFSDAIKVLKEKIDEISKRVNRLHA